MYPQKKDGMPRVQKKWSPIESGSVIPLCPRQSSTALRKMFKDCLVHFNRLCVATMSHRV